MAIRQKDKTVTKHPTSQVVTDALAKLSAQKKIQQKVIASKKATIVKKTQDYTISGTLQDTEGNPMADVIISDGYTCVKTDSLGHYP